MTAENTGFWARLDKIREALSQDRAAAQRSLDDLYAQTAHRHGPELAEPRRRVLAEFAATHGLQDPARDVAPVHDPRPLLAPDHALDGVSVVNGCMNREDGLLQSLETWLAAPEVSEIVIVDWSSKVPVAEALDARGIDDPRIVVARVEGETRYLHAEVHNVGFRLARYDRILKADAETMISPDFFRKNRLRRGHFIAGNWRRRPFSKGEVNGSAYLFRDDLLAIRGSSEYLQGYGWEDDDLYFRLWSIGLKRDDMAPGTLWSLEHDDDLRFGVDEDPPRNAREEIARDRQSRIDFNRLLTGVLPEWPLGSDWAAFDVTFADPRRPVLKRAGKPRDVLGPELRETMEVLNGYVRLSHVHEDVRNLSPDAVRRLIDTRRLDQIDRGVIAAALRETPPSAPMIATARRPRFFIDAKNGLGNRLRAIASAASIAEKSGHELVVIWQPDEHCECRMSDIVEYGGAVVEERFLEAAKAGGFQTFNYMDIEPGARKDEEVRPQSGNDIYARSAYVLNSPLVDWDWMAGFLRGLPPVEAVRDMVASVRNPNALSAHVRMVGGAEHTDLAYESRAVFTEAEFAEGERWRKRSHYENFFRRIDTLDKERGLQSMFVAADAQETYTAFAERFGERVVWLDRPVYDRSVEQLQYAMADMILLGRAEWMLGSTWSSFSEVAKLMSPTVRVMEMSGVDF